MKDAIHIGRVGALAVALGIGLAVGGPAALAWANPETSDSARGGNVESTGSVGSDSGRGSGPVDSASSRTGDRDDAQEAQQSSRTHRRSDDARNASRSDIELTSWRDRIRDRRTRPQREPVLTSVTVPSPSTPDRPEPVVPVGAIPVLAVGSAPRRDVLAATAASPTYSTSSTPVGRDPSGVAVSKDGSRAYVANSTDRSVSVVNTATGALTTSIPVGGTPSAVAVDPSPGSSRAYVALKSSARVSVVDTSNNTVTATVSVGLSPTAVAVSPSGSRVYVANTAGGTVSVIDSAASKRIATVSVGLSPVALAVSSDGNRVYAALRGSDQIAVMDAAKNTVITRVRVGDAPQDIAITSDGTRLYAVNGAGSVSVIDTSSNRVVAQAIAVGPSPTAAAVSRDGSRVYVANGNDTVSVIDTSSATVIQTFSIDTTPELGGHDIAISADGSRLYATDQRDAVLRVVTVVPGNNPPALTAGPSVGEPSSSTGAVSGSFTVRDLDGDPLSHTTVIPPASGEVAVTASPSAGSTAFAYVYTPRESARLQAGPNSLDAFTIRVTDARGAFVDVPVTVPVKPLTIPGFSAQVRTIAVSAPPSAIGTGGSNMYLYGNGSVFVLDIATGAVREVTAMGPDPAAVTPDGRRYVPNPNLYYRGDAPYDSIDVVSGTTNTVTKNIPLPICFDCAYANPSGPRDVMISPDGKRVYVSEDYWVETGINTTVVTVIDTTADVVLSYHPVSPVSDMEVTSDGRIYAASAEYPYVGVYDLGMTLTRTINLRALGYYFWSPPTRLALNAQQTRAYVEIEDYGLGIHHAVVDLSPTSPTYNTEVATITGSASALSPDGARRYDLQNDGKTVHVYDATSGAVIGQFATDASPAAGGVRAITVGADGRIYIADAADSAVYIVTPGGAA